MSNTSLEDENKTAMRFRIANGVLLAGLEGVCKIEKIDAQGVVYIAICDDDGTLHSFGRYWPGDIYFAPLVAGDFELYRG